ncbi:MAG: CheR family methyltransferase [Candidatus Saccharibacteria bacterium]
MQQDRALYQRFIEHLTINVSEFFRNKNHWDILEQQIIPMLLADKRSLRLWSAGCSTGEEPYSLAIMLKDRFTGKQEAILATDIDEEVLSKAKIGLYNAKSLVAVDERIKEHYFHQEGGFYRVKDEIKKEVNFRQHDLLKDVYPDKMDLILCRNVVIYFTEETKERLYQKFVNSLRPGGVIFIGSTEQIFQAREIGLKSIATFFYQKV